MRRLYRKPLPRAHVVVSLFAHPVRRQAPRDDFEVWRLGIRGLLYGGRERDIGRSVLIYRCNRYPKHVFWTIWALTFYFNLHFIAFTNTPAQFKKVKARQQTLPIGW